MAYLTYSGANTGSPNSVDLTPPAGLTAAQAATFRRRRARRRPVRLPGLPRDRRQRQQRPGPPLTHIGSIAAAAAIASTLRNPTAPMPSFEGLAKKSPKKFQNLVGFLSMLQ